MLVEFELNCPEELPDNLPATLVRQYRSLCPATAGDGILCLFQVANALDAGRAADMLYGSKEETGCETRIVKVSEDFYICNFI